MNCKEYRKSDERREEGRRKKEDRKNQRRIKKKEPNKGERVGKTSTYPTRQTLASPDFTTSKPNPSPCKFINKISRKGESDIIKIYNVRLVVQIS